jgi:inosine-uridine nucleoside N-ribohydrolase
MMTDEPSAASVHGRDGLGDAPNTLITDEGGDPLPMASWPEVDTLSAVERLLQVSRNEDGKAFDLLCTGPLTNLATALSLMRPVERDSFFNRTRAFVVMGGVFDSLGNITHSAEFNLFADPAAAQIVLSIMKQQDERAEQGKERPSVHFVSLDATEQVGIPLPLPQAKPKKGGQQKDQKERTLDFLRYALNQYGQFHVFSSAKRPGAPGIQAFEKEKYITAMLGGSSGASELRPFCYLHDGLAAWVLVQGLADQPMDTDLWNLAGIRIDANRGESRGRVIICPHNKEKGPVSFPSLGTAVKWLRLLPKEKGMFLTDIRNLFGIELPQPEEQTGAQSQEALAQISDTECLPG